MTMLCEKTCCDLEGFSNACGFDPSSDQRIEISGFEVDG